MALDGDSLNSTYHKKDMKLISDSKTEQKAIILSSVATSEKSLNSGRHIGEMNLISETKCDDVAICYGILSNSEDEDCYNEYIKYVDSYEIKKKMVKNKVKSSKVSKK